MNLTPAEYAQARELFHRLIALPPSEREAYLGQKGAIAPPVYAEVSSLLRYHESAPSGAPVDAAVSFEDAAIRIAQPQVEGRWRVWLQRVASDRRYLFILLGTLLAIALEGGRLGRLSLQNTLHNEISGHLTSLLDASFMALDLWSEHRFAEVQAWANDPEVRDSVIQLLATARYGDDLVTSLPASPGGQKLAGLLGAVLASATFEHYVVLDTTYQTLASDLPNFAGRRMRPDDGVTMRALSRIQEGGNLFLPRLLCGAAYNDRALMSQGLYYTWFGVPVRDETGRVLAALAFAVDASKYFDKILRVGRWGNSGETYAFNRLGQFLSEGRHFDAVRPLVKLSLDPHALPAVKDPGGNLTDGYIPRVLPEAWPLTAAVSNALDAAASGRERALHGIHLTPYRDYRGVEVVGAWRWDNEKVFALITEIDAKEALATLSFVDSLCLVLGGALVLALFLALLGALRSFAMGPSARLAARLGQYKLLRKIGEGGMGEVYLAKHDLLKRPTAIKVLKPTREDPTALQRFELEVRASCRLSHSNTVAIYDFGKTAGGCFYYVMEYLHGVSLARVIECEPQMPAGRAVYLLQQIVGSLREAHSLGLIHRDIKPLNIMVCRLGGNYDVVKVLDFGLVKSLSFFSELKVERHGRPGLCGTPAYLAPELLQDPDAASPRSDIYALGVVAYKMLSGRPVFPAANELSLFYDILHTRPRSLAELRPDLPLPLTELVMACLSKDPRLRPQDMVAVAHTLGGLAAMVRWTADDACQWWELRDHLMAAAS